MPTIISNDYTGNLVFTSGDDDVEILNGVTVTGSLDLDTGSADSLTNNGTITYTGAWVGLSAVNADADETYIENNGTIEGVLDRFFGPHLIDWAAGITVEHGTLTLDNGAAGTIVGGRHGVEIAGYLGGGGLQYSSHETLINNHGHIEGGDDGIRMHGGIVNNWGTIVSTGSFDLSAIGVTWQAYDGISSFGLDGQGMIIDPEVGLTTVNNHAGGVIEGPRSGMFLTGGGTVTNEGLFQGGDTGIGAQGGDFNGNIGANETPLNIINSGTISAIGGGPEGLSIDQPAAIASLGSMAQANIDNEGLITSVGDGILARSSINLTNEVGGVIQGDSDGDGVGVAIRSSADNGGEDPLTANFDDMVDNEGTINGDVLLGAGDDTVINDGTINGSLDLGQGALDSLTNSGTITYTGDWVGLGAVSGDADETYIVNSGVIESDLTFFVGATIRWGAGISIEHGTMTLVNEAGGSISGGRWGVEIAGYDDGGVINASDDTVINNYGSIVGGDDGIRMHGGTVNNWGTIATDGSYELSGIGVVWPALDGISSFGVEGQGLNIDPLVGLTVVNNHETGVIDGIRSGMFLTGGGTVTNDGLIQGGEAGVAAQSGSFAGNIGVNETPLTVINTGTIVADGTGIGGFNLDLPAGIASLNGMGQTTIENDGLISSVGNGIFAQTSIDLENGKDGVIQGDSDGDGVGVAIQSSADSHGDEDPLTANFDDTVVNDGTINGDIMLGKGDDSVMLTKTSEVNGDIHLGAGDDTIQIDKKGELNGTIFGGDGADVFVFDKKFEDTSIGDFEDGTDLIDISAASKYDFDDLVVAQMGADTHIMVGNSLIVLENFSAADVDASDFSFG